MESKFLGKIVEWKNYLWYVDKDDENFKDAEEETSLLLLPDKYADANEMDKLMRFFGDIDTIGFWVHESEVSEIVK